MTRTTNSRIAGVTYFVYFVAGVASMFLSGAAARGAGIAAQLATIAQHATEYRLVVLLTVICAFSALVLGVTLYALTRDQDPDLAMLALLCRVIECVNGATSVWRSLGALSLATAAGAHAANTEATHTLAAFLLAGGFPGISASFFAVGSTIFCYLLLKGRMIPMPLAWLGVVGSALVLGSIPLQHFGIIAGSWSLWMPLLVFELTFAAWLIVKGAAMPPAPRLDRIPEYQ